MTECNLERAAAALVQPLLVLGTPRSFTTVVSAMLGQHPQMYGLPETHLLRDETLADWWARAERALYPMSDGLVRTVAQLCFGEQTESSVRRARGWLRRRLNFTTGYMFEVLAQKVHPAMMVEKSPSMVYYPDALERIFSLFPKAKFLHLVRHPRGHGESVMRFMDDVAKHGPIPPWLIELASFPAACAPDDDVLIDPQRSWYVLNMNICKFLASVPAAQKLQCRGEDFLTEPDENLRHVAAWLGVRTDEEAIEAMKHPEHSPYACYGPPGALLGNDYFFLASPALRPSRAEPQSLEGPLSWRPDGAGFTPEVKGLAQAFGYQ